MTTELRKTIEPSDIIAIEVECANCHSRTVRRVDNWQQSIRMCSNCQSMWQGASTPLGLLEEVTHKLLQLSAFTPDKVPFTIRLELKPEEK